MNTANFLSIPSTMFPDQEILVFEGTRLTYGQELERVRRLASMLRNLGIKPGDRVAMLQTNSHQFIEAYYATATLGATFVPLNYRAKPPELEYMVTAATVKALFVGDRYLDLVHPSLVIASLGAVNDYGHMHAQAKATYARHGIPWYRTDQNGSIIIRSPGTRHGGYTITPEHTETNLNGPTDRRSRQLGCS